MYIFGSAGALVMAHGIFLLQRMAPLVVALGFSCSVAYEILLLLPGITPASNALQGRFLTTGPWGKPQGSLY